jgi:hypothetical protein
MSSEETLREEIIDIELEMFLAVSPVAPADCQQYSEGFKLHRRAQFSTWSKETLDSYLNDLQQARENGENVMATKYLRMQGRIPTVNANPLIGEIVAIQLEWQREMFKKYPKLMANARPVSQDKDSTDLTSFETYLKGELETYSNRTLALLHRDIQTHRKNGINMSERLYRYLVKQLGYASIDQAEQNQTELINTEG